jgi:hypothetical protein
MKTFMLFISLVFVGVSLSFSQVNSNYDGPKPEVREGAKSFVFRYTPFQSNLDPSYISTVSVYDESAQNLYGAGFRYFVTNEIAVALGLNFGTGSSTQEFTGGDKSETSSTSFGVAVDANYHFKPLYSVSPYVGLNVNFGSYSSNISETVEGTTVETDYSGSGFGAGVNFGFDWYFTEGLSLGGKYTLGFRSLGKPEEKSGNVTVEGPSSSGFGIGSASVILNVHF